MVAWGSFQTAGIDLLFLKPGPVAYRQFNESFVDNLSIIDVLMFNAPEKVKRLLLHYELLSPTR